MNQSKHIAIIGAGIAGMEAATHLAKAGYKVTIIEKEKSSGGNLNKWSHLFPDLSDPEFIISRLSSNLSNNNVKIITNTEITNIGKNKKHFFITSGDEMSINADAIVIASGFKIFDATFKEEYGYRIFSNVITSEDIELIVKQKKNITTSTGKVPKRVAFIHCVGSRDAKSGNNYCSKICCITGIKQAIEFSKMLPECEIFCFYMDLRLYGSKYDELYLIHKKDTKYNL